MGLLKTPEKRAWRVLRWRLQDRWRRMTRAACRRAYRDKRGEAIATVLVAGTARSGTTWLGDLVASARPTRILFEPFHARLVEPYSHFPEFLYMRPEEDHDDLAAFCRRVFSGRIRHPWIDRQVNCLRPRLRVVKEVRVNLLLKWLAIRFPEIRFVVILRHPCAVVSSRMEVGWSAEADLRAFLSQRRLAEDFLGDRMDLIEAANTEEERQALVWCISYLVPLRQFGDEGLPAVFYEHLVLRPETEIPRAFALAGLEVPESVFEFAKRPSLTAKADSAVVTGGDTSAGWRSRLAPDSVQRILSIVRGFGLGDLYDESASPLDSAGRYLARHRDADGSG